MMNDLGLTAEVPAELSNVLDDGHVVLSTVIPELWGWELLLQNTGRSCVIKIEKIRNRVWDAFTGSFIRRWQLNVLLMIHLPTAYLTQGQFTGSTSANRMSLDCKCKGNWEIWQEPYKIMRRTCKFHTLGAMVETWTLVSRGVRRY